MRTEIKRAALFAILFPLLCALFYFPAAVRDIHITEMAMMLSVGYLILFLPALALAVVDYIVSRWHHAIGIISATIGAAIVIPLWIRLILPPTNRFNSSDAMLVGVVSAASATCALVLSRAIIRGRRLPS